jgi:hypothetical protein
MLLLLFVFFAAFRALFVLSRDGGGIGGLRGGGTGIVFAFFARTRFCLFTRLLLL